MSESAIPIEMTAEPIEPSKDMRVAYTPAVIEDNLAALEAYVEEEIAPYVGAVIDPDDNEQVKGARACMKALNDLKRPIDNERKRVKFAYERPLKEFEAKVKAITTKIDDVRGGIKAQVDAADAAFKERRRALLEEEYAGCAGPIADVIAFEAVLDPKWLNRSTSEAKAMSELGDKVASALKGYKTLQSKELAHKDEVVKRYADTLDLVAALELEDELADRDRQMAEFKAAQQAAEAAKREAMERAAELGSTIIIANRPKNEPAATHEAKAPEPVSRWSLAMEFEGTEAFARDVAAALKELGVTGATIKCLGVVGNV